MDDFYRIENIEVFKKWVYFQVQNDPRLTIEKYDERTYKIFYKKRVARFVVWPIGIVEEAINEDDQLLFYLHYQFQSYHFAIDLFYRMISKLTEERQEEKRILLCCTGGMTTGFFAEKMNKFCELNKVQYHIDATPAYHLQDIYKDYDLILIAPQLRYKMIELSNQLKPVVIQPIDPVTFATYDCQALLEQIQKYYKSEEKQ
ncbi:MAG: PTS sugar transporter subunit IIB [Longibaculum sp.]